MTNLLEVESLVKFFPLDRHSVIAAVNDVSFTIGVGETLGLVGESGSGKTTVGRCVLRVLDPTAGRVIFKGIDLTDLKGARLRALRKHFQLVFQEPGASLNPRMSVHQIIEEPLRLSGVENRSERQDRIHATLRALQLDRGHLDRYPWQLTTSDQQRIGIARALITRPELVVLDEPTSNLDPTARAGILDLLQQIQREYGTSFLLISHDLTAVTRISHRVAVMYLGKIVELADSREIERRQLHPYARALLSAVLYPDPTRALTPFLLSGEIPSPINPRDECSLAPRCPFAAERCLVAYPPFREIEPAHYASCYRLEEIQAAGWDPEALGSRGLEARVDS